MTLLLGDVWRIYLKATESGQRNQSHSTLIEAKLAKKIESFRDKSYFIMDIANG